MRRAALGIIIFFLWVSAGAAQDFVVVCPITGMIDDGVAVLVERAVHEAAGAKAVIFEIDTPGGMVDSAIRTTTSILSAPCPTIAYIKGMGAISAGALISFACKDIIMTPDTNIGAATPVVASPEGMLPTGEKEVSFMRAKMRALAERNNRNPALGESMVDKDIELRSRVDANGNIQVYAVYPPSAERAVVPSKAPDPADAVRKAIDNLPPELDQVKKIAKEVLPESDAEPPAAQTPAEPPTVPGDTQVILPAGKLLTLTPKEAIQYGLIPATAATLDDVLAHYGYTGAEVRRITPTWAEAVFRWLANPLVAGLLLMFGIGGLYIELKTPGVVLPGIVGVVCLALFFGSHYIIGVAAWLPILLVVAGLFLIAAEIFVIPGFGAFGAIGIVCVILGLGLTLTGVTVPQYSWDYDRVRNAAISLTVAAVALTVLAYATWKLFPHTPLYGRFVQTHAQTLDLGYVVQTADEETAAIGLKGVAASMLRPAGRGRFGDETYQVVSRGEYIPQGTPIVIVQVDGNRYVVERTEDKTV